MALRPWWKARKAGVWCQRAMAAALPCVLTEQEGAKAGRRQISFSDSCTLDAPLRRQVSPLRESSQEALAQTHSEVHFLGDSRSSHVDNESHEEGSTQYTHTHSRK